MSDRGPIPEAPGGIRDSDRFGFRERSAQDSKARIMALEARVLSLEKSNKALATAAGTKIGEVTKRVENMAEQLSLLEDVVIALDGADA